MSQPFQVAVRFNREMHKWDLQVIVEGFRSEGQARDAAKKFAEILAGEKGSFEPVLLSKGGR